MSKFVEAVVHLLKLDDEGKVTKFQKQALKEATEQIEIRTKEVNKLKEKKEEYMKERAPETMHKLSVDSIGTIDDREAYIDKTFFPMMFKIREETKGFDAQIKVAEEDIEDYRWVLEQLK